MWRVYLYAGKDEGRATADGERAVPASSAAGPPRYARRTDRTHALRLIQVAKLLLRDQESAEDVVQDAGLALYRAMPRPAAQ
jgi:DNA-directed RNA polymerase specialized sigma24 family protein